jgi:2-iminobutanoate/2-iminopropanoate deaminase
MEGAVPLAHESIDLDYMKHNAPIPMGSRIGNLVMSSSIGAYSESLGKTPDDVEGRAHAMFENVRNFMKAAGGTPEDIIKMVFMISEGTSLDPINKEWVAMFPDEHKRPARHAEISARFSRPDTFTVEIVAVIQ